jgi:hypothetical protein
MRRRDLVATFTRCSSRPRRRCSWVPLLALAFTSNAVADLQDDVTRLARGAKTHNLHHLGPRVLEQGEELPLLVPERLAPKKSADCLHLVALSAQTVQFVLNIPSFNEMAEDLSLPSRAGLLEFVRCGSPDVTYGDLSLTMLSPRGALDVVSYTDQSPVAGALKRLPWRNSGREATELSLEHRVAVGNLSGRIGRLERHAAFRLADRTEQKAIPNQDLESGEVLVGFDPGCHEVKLVIDLDTNQTESLDLSPEFAWTDDSALFAPDTSSSHSPTFIVCTATARIARLSFIANSAYLRAVLFRAHYPWPTGIPSNWATEVRNQMALALFRRHLPSLTSPPSQSWVGSSNATSLRMAVAPRSCYLAIVAANRASQSDISLSIANESRWIADASLEDVGASVAFCVSQAGNVKLDVDARGSNVVWILGVWAIANGPLHADFT